MKNTLLIFSAFIFLSACVTSSKIESKWRNEAYKDKKYTKIACLAAMKTISDNSSFEKKAAEKLKEINIQPFPRYELLNPADTSFTKEELKTTLHENDIEAIVVFKLIGVQKDKTYNPPVEYNTGGFYNYYGSSFGYYDYYYPAYRTTRTDGYWSETYYYVIETNIYDVEDEELIWTAKTTTSDPKNFQDLASSVIDRVIKTVQEEKRKDKSQ